MNVQNNSKRQNIFKRKRTQATSREKNAIIMILQNISHESVESRRDHKVSLLSNENLKI